MLWKWAFMHLIATNLFVLVDWALSTSEKVPAPFLLISLYSNTNKNGSLQVTAKARFIFIPLAPNHPFVQTLFLATSAAPHSPSICFTSLLRSVVCQVGGVAIEREAAECEKVGVELVVGWVL